MKTRSIILFMSSAILFTACSPIYNMKPVFNEKNKTLSIDGKVFTDARLDRETVSPRASGVITRKQYYLKDNTCDAIYTSDNQTKGKWYITRSNEDFLRNQAIEKNNMYCDIKRISNIKFSKCYDKRTLRDKFYIASTESSKHGYKRVNYLTNMSKKCFNSIFTHFENKAKNDNTEIKEYSFGKK